MTFSILHVFWISNQLYFKPPQQSRHPERSASRIYRKQELYGAESKDPGDTYPAHAVRGLFGHEAREQNQPDFLRLGSASKAINYLHGQKASCFGGERQQALEELTRPQL